MENNILRTGRLLFFFSVIVFACANCTSTNTTTDPCANLPESMNEDSLYQFYQEHKPYSKCELAAIDIDKTQMIGLLAEFNADSIVIAMVITADSTLNIALMNDTINCLLAGICCPGNCPPVPRITYAHSKNHATESSGLDIAYSYYLPLIHQPGNDLLGLVVSKKDLVHALSNFQENIQTFAFVKVNGALKGLFMTPSGRCGNDGICCPGNCPVPLNAAILQVFENHAH